MITRSLLLATTLFSSVAAADVAVTLYGGQSFSQSLETKEGTDIDLEDANHFAFSIDRTITDARYGFYYSANKSDIQGNNERQVNIQHYMFQSAVEYPLASSTTGYFGAQIGAANVDPEWLSSDTYFATGLFTGAGYHVTDNAQLMFEVRWLATIINNDSDFNCTISNDPNDQCLWHFDGDVLNQFNTSLAFSMRF
ncbi:hypothetical protein CWC05_13505 [Pseudoalteromonas ruthenica]|uniref:Outer membrane protein beta-barrel domain-containing protein n=1 Tax=Pseudoalteromonas ruthenica TaxID=151081 RepID=A0A5S3Z327_9GAMM|nr:outer membrane beta-barrel protein [Pseudoalteromonas ruthenica]TMP86421.1 hypothetical protein CWC05_13505 [Pseudoalteromonas ruthenica]